MLVMIVMRKELKHTINKTQFNGRIVVVVMNVVEYFYTN